MTIEEQIDKCLNDTDSIKEKYPTVTQVRHDIYNIPYNELLFFAQQKRVTITKDEIKQRVFIIYSPYINNRYDTDIWLYSTVKIKPAEIIAD